jgi:RES domain
MSRKKKAGRSRARRRPKKSILLDAFTQPDLDSWNRHGESLQAAADRVYFDLERQRAAQHEALCKSLHASAAIAIDVAGWVRVTEWRWNLTPLSAAGSLKGIGRRFSVGEELDRARNQAFPCLYLAENVDTAYAEYFGGPLESVHGQLSLSELALRRPSSFTTFRLEGHLELVFDLRTNSSLVEFANIIRQFDISPSTKNAIRAANLPPRKIVRNAPELWKWLLEPPSAWRLQPQAYGIPAACQIFGQFVRDAGFEALLYPSQQGDGLCLAVYPENFSGSAGRIQVVGDVPDGATITVLDKDNRIM